MKLCFYGEAGVGKSTAATFLCSHYRNNNRSAAVVKLAAPLYALQARVYEYAGVEAPKDRQDRVLMEALAGHLRRINPSALATAFRTAVERQSADLIINDDLRDPSVDYQTLREQGFVFARLRSSKARRAQRLRHRGDLTGDLDSASELALDMIKPDVELINDGESLDAYHEQLLSALERLSA